VSDLPEIYLDILGPVLILIACGVGAGRWLDISPEPFAKLAFWVIGPAFMYNALAKAGLPTGGMMPRVGRRLFGDARQAAGWRCRVSR